MPRQTKTAAASGKAVLPQLSQQMLEELIPGPVTKEQFNDIFENFKKAFIERAMGAEMSHHLGYSPGQAKTEGVTNHRNGTIGIIASNDKGWKQYAAESERLYCAGSIDEL